MYQDSGGFLFCPWVQTKIYLSTMVFTKVLQTFERGQPYIFQDFWDFLFAFMPSSEYTNILWFYKGSQKNLEGPAPNLPGFRRIPMFPWVQPQIYHSNHKGSPQIWVGPFPNLTGFWRVPLLPLGRDPNSPLNLLLKFHIYTEIFFGRQHFLFFVFCIYSQALSYSNLLP